MTRTIPAYTVRWSSQVSRVNNRIVPTAAPNSVNSAAMPSTMTIFNTFYSNIRQMTMDSHDSHTVDLTSPLSNAPDRIQLESGKQPINPSNISSPTMLQLIMHNKLSCLLISIWVYHFVFVDL